MARNIDKKDPEFTTLYEALEKLFKNKNLTEITQDEMTKNIEALKKIYEAIKELNRENDLLKAKYEYDTKFARTHKRIKESGQFNIKEQLIHKALIALKYQADEHVLINNDLLKNESYFDQLMINMVIEEFKKKNKVPLNAESAKYINNLVVTEYINEFLGKSI